MKCWSCGRLTMFRAPELGKDWYKCCECGATYADKLPKLRKRGRRNETTNPDTMRKAKRL